MKNMLRSLYLNVISNFSTSHLSNLLENYKDILYANQITLGSALPNSNVNLEYLSIGPIIKEICILTYSYITTVIDKIDVITIIMNIEKENIKDNIQFENLDLDDNVLVKVISNIIKLSVPYYGITDTIDNEDAKFYIYTLPENLSKDLDRYIASTIIPYCKKKESNFNFDYEFFNNPICSSIMRSQNYHDKYVTDFDYTSSLLESVYNSIRYVNTLNNDYNEIMSGIVETEPILTRLLHKLMRLEYIYFYPKDSIDPEDLQYLINIDVRYNDTVPRSSLNQPNSVVLDISTLVCGDNETICSIGIYKQDSNFIITSGCILDEEKISTIKTHWVIKETDDNYISVLDNVVEFFENIWSKYWYQKIIDKFNSLYKSRHYLSDLLNINEEYTEDDDTDEYQETIPVLHENSEEKQLKPTEVFDIYYEEAQNKGLSKEDSLKYAIDKCANKDKGLN